MFNETIKTKDMVITITSTHDIPRELVNRFKRCLLKDKNEFIISEKFGSDYKASLKEGENIGDKIKILRVKEKISQIELAKALKMKQPQLSNIENGNHIPSMKTLKKIADALKVDIKDLI